MTILIATMFFAQSLLGDLVGKAAEVAGVPEKPAVVEEAPAPAAEAEAVEEPAAKAAEEAAAAEEPAAEEAAPAEEAKAEEPAPAEPKQETPDNPDSPDDPGIPDIPVVPAEPVAAPEPVVEESAPNTSSTNLPTPRSVKITSERTDYDRREGVIMFDRNVFVEDEEYKMHSDQLYVFLDGTNELKRIVAIGNVTITNETRVGSCAKAAYTRSVGKVVMYGDGKGVMAKLADNGKRKSEVEGRKITFWIASEQVEVEGSKVTLDTGGFGGKEGAKRLLGK